MLKIRLQRIGRKNEAHFRVVVTEHTRAAQAGNIVETVGSYNPKSKARILKKDRIEYWISVGAQPSDTVHNMLVAEGVIKGKKVNVLPKKTPLVKEPTEEEKKAAEAAAAPAEETPAAEEAPVAEEVSAEETPAEAAA